VNDEWLDRLASNLSSSFRGRDPSDPATVAGVDGTVRRMRDVVTRMDEKARTSPPPFPGKPWPRIEMTEAEADRVREQILANLP
jgi:hypothetical protein